MFEKGKQKTGGRAKGTPNALNRELREVVRELVEGNVDRIRADLEALEPRERVSAWLKLAEFVLPKLQRSEVSVTKEPEQQTTWVIALQADNPQPEESEPEGRRG